MKVYLVHNEYYDYDENMNGSILLGIYSSDKLAKQARDSFVTDELNECEEMDCPAILSMDADCNPMVAKFRNGEPVGECTFTIEEWTVQ